MARPPALDADAVRSGLDALPGWAGDPAGIRRTVAARDFPAAIRLVDRVAEVAEQMDHHPDIDIRWRTVTFGLCTHSAGGVTDLDLELAQRIDALAADAGAS